MLYLIFIIKNECCIILFKRNLYSIFNRLFTCVFHILLISLFFYFWLCWVFVAMWAFYQFQQMGATVCGILMTVTSLVAEPRPQGTQASEVAVCGLRSYGSQALDHRLVVVRGLSCSTAYGISPDQESNPCLLHWQVDSLPPSQQGNLTCVFRIHVSHNGTTSPQVEI